MGAINGFIPEKLVIGILTTVPEKTGKLLEILEKEFGSIDYLSPEFAFDYTEYYTSEMGRPILRIFASFEDTVNPENLAEIKIRTNSVESLFAENGNRKVNLDPGLMSLDRFMLATTKNNGHRVPLRGGIYAEITLLFMKKKFHPLPWTYSDYRSPEYMETLSVIRRKYKENLKQLRNK